MKHPWINQEVATTEEIVKQIEKCPSGALGFYYQNEEKNKMENKEEKPTVELKFNKDGSMKVTGAVNIVLPDQTSTVKAGRFSICRCGLSAKKPFCDGAHKETGFDKNWDIEVILDNK